jgi:hypothetical protein
LSGETGAIVTVIRISEKQKYFFFRGLAMPGKSGIQAFSEPTIVTRGKMVGYAFAN